MASCRSGCARRNPTATVLRVRLGRSIGCAFPDRLVSLVECWQGIDDLHGFEADGDDALGEFQGIPGVGHSFSASEVGVVDDAAVFVGGYKRRRAATARRVECQVAGVG